MIDVRWPQHRYVRRAGWAGQRLPMLPRLLARAKREESEQGGAGSFAGDLVFHRAALPATVDAVGGGPAVGAAVPPTPDAGAAVLGELLVSRASRPAGVIDVARALAEHARLSTGAGREEPLLAGLHARSGAATADFASALGASPALAAGEARALTNPLGERDREAADIGGAVSPELRRAQPATAGGVGLPVHRGIWRGIVPPFGSGTGGDPATGAAGKAQRARHDSASGAEIAVGEARPVMRPVSSEVGVARQTMTAAASAAETWAPVAQEQFCPAPHPPSAQEVWAPLARGARDHSGREVHPTSRGPDAGASEAARAGVLRPDVAPVATGGRRTVDRSGAFADRAGSVDASEAKSSGRSPAGLVRVLRPGRAPAGTTVVDRQWRAAGSPASLELSRRAEPLAGEIPGIRSGVPLAVDAGETVAAAALVPRDNTAAASAATSGWPVRRPALVAMHRSGRMSSPVAADQPSANSGTTHFVRAAPLSTISIAAPEDDATGAPLAIAIAAGRRPTIDSARAAGQATSPTTASGQPLLSRFASPGQRSQPAIVGGAALPALAGGGAFTTLRHASALSPALPVPEIAAPASREAGAFIWRRPLSPGAAGQSDAVGRVANDARATSLALAAGAVDAAGPASAAPKWADRQAADAGPAPAGTGSPSSGEVDWERLVSEVSRRIRRQLMVERERRGWRGWN